MRAADEVEAGLLHEPDVARHVRFGHRVSPPGLVLVDIGAAEVQMLAIQEEALVGSPSDGANAEGSHVPVSDAAAIQHGRL